MRARNIKPSFFKSDALGSCSPLARLLFQGLWCMADHEGRLHYRPRRIKVEILPYDDVDVGDLIAELIAADPDDPMIRLYGGTEESPAYLWIPRFRAHQSPCRREREKASAIPACPECPPDNDRPTGLVRVPDATEHNAIPVPSRDRPGSADIRITDVRIADSGCTDPPDGAADPAAAPGTPRETVPGEDIAARWNALARERGLVACKAMGRKRQAALRERWSDPFWRGHWEEALERLRHIRWVRGETSCRWRADLDWFLRVDTVTKLVEGGYDDNIKGVGAGRPGPGNPF